MNRGYSNKLGSKRPRRQHTPKEEVNETVTKLRTLLKLPKAHKWVIYEWFYGNIDQTLFGCDQQSEFQQCLKEIFPQLKTNQLRRVEWCQVRRLMGKPRRCSAAFFAEERQALKAKRDKIRQIQHQQKVDNLANYRDLPESIPMPLVIGTKVTALQHKPHDGLFTGVIEAVDILNGTYRVTFDRPGIGADSVPDFECRSIPKAEFMPLTAFQYKLRTAAGNPLPSYSQAKLMQILGDRVTNTLQDDLFDHSHQSQHSFSHHSHSHLHTSSTTTSASAGAGPLTGLGTGATGAQISTAYPIKFLAQIVHLFKLLDVKRRKIYDLKMMNTEIEKIKSSFEEVVGREIKQEYAHTLIELEKINKHVNESLQAVRQFTVDFNLLGSDPRSIEKRKNGALDLIQKHSSPSVRQRIGDDKSIGLISNLLSIMLHLKSFNHEVNGEGIKDLLSTIQQAKQSVCDKNVATFEDKIEIHLKVLQSKIDQLGSLSAFMDSKETLDC